MAENYVSESTGNLDKISDDLDLTPIQKFYDRASVLITGSTGFLGNILVEKLLRSCPTVSTLYLLVRKKKGKNLEERLDEMFKDVIFDKLKEKCPNFRQKVVGVGGDCALPGLGLSEQDSRLLIDEINIVFHVAATVRFDENMKTAVEINIRGSQDLLRLSKKMEKLKSFIHVSSVYANSPKQHIEEKVYPPDIDGNKLILIVNSVPEKILNDITPRLLGEYPNTYAFSKQIAEDIVKQESDNMPVGIFRPSIVVSTYKEPIPAWINNLYGPAGVSVAAGVGLLRIMHADVKAVANMVPVDMCVNTMIASAWQVGETYEQAVKDKKLFEVSVYNYESNTDRPITWVDMLVKSEMHGHSYPSIKAIWFFVHDIPAILTDTVLLCMGKKPRMIKAYRKLDVFAQVMSYFALRTWTLNSDNVRNLISQMSEKDKEIFWGDLKELDWGEYQKKYFLGVRMYLIKDPLDTLEAARKKWNRLYYAHELVKFTLIMLVIILVSFCVSRL